MGKPLLLSTKKLDPALRERVVHNGIAYMEYDAIRIAPVSFSMPNPTDYVIFSSQNATKAVLKSEHWLAQTQVLCVGEQSEKLLLNKGIKTVKTTKNMSEMVVFIEKLNKNASFLHFCGNRRLALLATKMAAWGRNFREEIVYETALHAQKINATPNAILFYSPSGVESHEKENNVGNSRCFCIGASTAKAFVQQPKELVVIDEPRIKTLVAKAIQHVKKHQHA